MCTFIILHTFGNLDYNILAGNRDELIEKPFNEPPGRIKKEKGPAIYASLAGEGKACCGVNSAGLAAVITNILSEEKAPNPDYRSRGKLVLDVLSQWTLEGVQKLLGREERKRRYNPFILTCFDQKRIYQWVNPGGKRWEKEALPPGLQVVTSEILEREPKTELGCSLKETYQQRKEKIREYFEDFDFPGKEEFRRDLKEILSCHEPRICSHTPISQTKGSQIIEIDKQGINYFFAPGNPCRVGDYQKRECYTGKRGG